VATKLSSVRENGCLEFFDITNLSNVTKKTAGNCYALRVRGDAMVPFQKDGDILIVEKNSRREKIKHGDTVVCHRKEGSYVKSFDLTNGIIKLRPLDLSFYNESEPVTNFTEIDKIIFLISS